MGLETGCKIIILFIEERNKLFNTYLPGDFSNQINTKLLLNLGRSYARFLILCYVAQILRKTPVLF